MGCQKLTYYKSETTLGENWKVFASGIEKTASSSIFCKDYYAFGSVMPNANNLNIGDHTYGFNGQLKDDEVKGVGNSLDFGARSYDPRLGRWFATDPAHQFTSPYLAMGNNPLIAPDRDGRVWPYIIAAGIGGGFNVWAHWDDITKGSTGFGDGDAWKRGVGTFGLGAAGGVASFSAPGLSFVIMPAVELGTQKYVMEKSWDDINWTPVVASGIGGAGANYFGKFIGPKIAPYTEKALRQFRLNRMRWNSEGIKYNLSKVFFPAIKKETFSSVNSSIVTVMSEGMFNGVVLPNAQSLYDNFATNFDGEMTTVAKINGMDDASKSLIYEQYKAELDNFYQNVNSMGSNLTNSSQNINIQDNMLKIEFNATFENGSKIQRTSNIPIGAAVGAAKLLFTPKPVSAPRFW